MPNDPSTPFNQCCFLTSHNAYANRADGWVWPQQNGSVDMQLAAGIRAFMVDICHANINGVEDVFLLHDGWVLSYLFPKFQFRVLTDFLRTVATFLDNNPRETVTIFFEAHDSLKKTTGVLLLQQVLRPFNSYIFRPTGQQDFYAPLRNFGGRMVIFSDYRGTDTFSRNANDRFGLPSVWHYFIETNYGDSSLNSDTWVTQRAASLDSQSQGRAMGIMNHFPTLVVGKELLNDNPQLPSGSVEKVFFTDANDKTKLFSHAVDFRMAFGMSPNFIAVDRVDLGTGPAEIVDFCIEMAKTQGWTLQIKGINNQFMTADDSTPPKWLYCKTGTPATFEVIGPLNNCALKFVNPAGTDLYLNYRTSTGAVKLYDDYEDSTFNLIEISPGVIKIQCVSNGQFMYLSDMDGDLYITGSGGSKTDGSNYFIACFDSVEPRLEEFVIQATIGTTHNGEFMACVGGYTENNEIQVQATTPAVFRRIGPRGNCVLLVTTASPETLFMSYRGTTGCLKLYSEPTTWAIIDEDSNNLKAYMMRSLVNGGLLYPESGDGYIYLKSSGPYTSGFWSLRDPVLQVPV